MYKFIVLKALIPLATVFLSSLAFLTTAEERLLYAVQPFLPAVSLERIYGPLTSKLSRDLNIPVQFRTRRSMSSYQDAIQAEVFDIILVNPFEFLALQTESNYIPIIQRRSQMKSILYVIDNNFDQLNKLRGKKIGFPPQEAAISVLAIQSLQDDGLGVGDYTTQFFNEHLSCKQALVVNQVHACMSSFNFVDDRLVKYDREYHAIWESPAIPSSVIMIHKRIVQREQQLREWFLALNSTEEGQKILDETFLGDLKVFNDADYRVLKDFQQNLN